jgi:hypothetical protein
MKSRKRARKVTSEFHKLYAKKKTGGDKDGQIEKQIRVLGGHRAYHNRTLQVFANSNLKKVKKISHQSLLLALSLTIRIIIIIDNIKKKKKIVMRGNITERYKFLRIQI